MEVHFRLHLRQVLRIHLFFQLMLVFLDFCDALEEYHVFVNLFHLFLGKSFFIDQLVVYDL